MLLSLSSPGRLVAGGHTLHTALPLRVRPARCNNPHRAMAIVPTASAAHQNRALMTPVSAHERIEVLDVLARRGALRHHRREHARLQRSARGLFRSHPDVDRSHEPRRAGVCRPVHSGQVHHALRVHVRHRVRDPDGAGRRAASSRFASTCGASPFFCCSGPCTSCSSGGATSWRPTRSWVRAAVVPRASQKAVLRWAMALYVYPVCCRPDARAASGRRSGSGPADDARGIAAHYRRVCRRSYAAIVRQNVPNCRSTSGIIFFYPRILGVFLFGLWVWRAGSFATCRRGPRCCAAARSTGSGSGSCSTPSVALKEIYHPIR